MVTFLASNFISCRAISSAEKLEPTTKTRWSLKADALRKSWAWMMVPWNEAKPGNSGRFGLEKWPVAITRRSNPSLLDISFVVLSKLLMRYLLFSLSNCTSLTIWKAITKRRTVTDLIRRFHMQNGILNTDLLLYVAMVFDFTKAVSPQRWAY